MQEETQTHKVELPHGPSTPSHEFIGAAEDSLPQAEQRGNNRDGGKSSADGAASGVVVAADKVATIEAEIAQGEPCIPISKPPQADDENVETPRAVDESDPVAVELDAKLEALLTKDVELSAEYRKLLLNHRKARRERRSMRAELRRLHTEEGGVLLEVKMHRARKGRGGQWEEYLRQTKPKPLSRTTADRWIGWFMGSQEQSKSAQPSGEAPENAPQDENGAFSGGGVPPPRDSSEAQEPDADDSASGNGLDEFEDVQRTSIILESSKMARFKADTKFLVTKFNFDNSHEAIFFTVDDAATMAGFVYPPTVTEEGETKNASKGINPGIETIAGGSEAARKDSTLDKQQR